MAVERYGWKSDQERSEGTRREIYAMRTACRLKKKPLLPHGQEGCVWLEKLLKIPLIVAAASGPAGQWCWAEQRAVLPEQIAEPE